MTTFLEDCGDFIRWLCCLVVGHKPITYRDAIPEDRTLAAMFRQASGTSHYCRRCGRPMENDVA